MTQSRRFGGAGCHTRLNLASVATVRCPTTSPRGTPDALSEGMAALQTKIDAKRPAVSALRVAKPYIFSLLIALGSSVGATGCMVEGDVPPPDAPVVADGYEPAYYDGYVVYYDDYGRPYYYAGGAAVWISPGVPEYVGLVHHWHVYGPYYHRWYAHYGHAYRGYRGYYRRGYRR